LSTDGVIHALAEATGASADEPEVRATAAAAEGSVGRAVSLLDGSALALRQRIFDLFAQLPNPDPLALHALGDAIGGTDPKTLEAFMDLVNGWLSGRLAETLQGKAGMARVAETWERVNQDSPCVQTFRLHKNGRSSGGCDDHQNHTASFCCRRCSRRRRRRFSHALDSAGRAAQDRPTDG
jgi:DNA polymerase-3 subunit delta'